MRSLICILFMACIANAQALTTTGLDVAYKPHLSLITSAKGFAIHGVLLGNEPKPANTAYADLNGSPERYDRFELLVSWKTNPPLTPDEVRRLQVLENWAKSVPDPHMNAANFAEIAYFHTKIVKSQTRPVELEISLFLADLGANVLVKDYEFVVDRSEAPTEPAYFPGLSINHAAQLAAVTPQTLGMLSAPWAHYFQPVRLNGTFAGPHGIGNVSLRFIRHESRLTVTGVMTVTAGVKLSVLSSATYNGTVDPTLPSHSEPPFYRYLNPSGQNWLVNPVNVSQFNPRFADLSQ